MDKIYLDSSATTPVYPEAVQAMVRCMNTDFGNPSSSHSFGRNAKKLLRHARKQVAALLHADEDEIFFTSGGTEADNLAVLGIAELYEKGHIITTPIEHHAILRSCEHLAAKGFDITYLPVDIEGRVNAADVERAIRPDTVLISVMHGNNEVGTVQPVEEIGRIASTCGITFHVDAVQSLGKIEVDVERIGCDLLTCSSHKINGPKGVGALYIRKGTAIGSMLFGGGQEKSIRSGTENMPGIVGFGKAAEITAGTWRQNADYTRDIRDYFFRRLVNEFDDIRINGSMVHRLPHNINFSVKGVDGISLMLLLDSAGIAVSTGSACSSDSVSASHVLSAMNIGEEWLECTIRMTLSACNTKEQMDYVIDMLKAKKKLLHEAMALCSY